MPISLNWLYNIIRMCLLFDLIKIYQEVACDTFIFAFGASHQDVNEETIKPENEALEKQLELKSAEETYVKLKEAPQEEASKEGAFPSPPHPESNEEEKKVIP